MDSRAVVALAVALVAVICDVRTRRIPNVLTLGAAATALAYALGTGGLGSLGQAALGWLVGTLLFFPIFALRGMGAGDVKLLAALGAWLGPVEAAWLAIFASIAGGVFGAAVALYHGYLQQAFGNVWLILTHWRVAGVGPVAGFTLRDARAPRLAYAIPIMAGVLCTLWRR